MSHADSEYEFQNNQCVMIYGENETDPGADSNGSGKSTLIEGITLAITGSTNRDVNKDSFIADDADETYVQFDLTNQVCKIKTLSIRRWFDRKKSSRIELWENGEKNTQVTSVIEANNRILELIGLTREDFIHFFVIGQDTHYSFLTAGDAEKKNIIARFSNTQFISDKIEELKSSNKGNNLKLNDLKEKVTKLENKMEFIEGEIKDEKENYLQRIETKISGYTNQIDKYKLKISEGGEKRMELEEKVILAERDILIKKDALKDTTELYDRVKKLKGKIAKIKKERNKTQDDIAEAEHLINHLENIKKGRIDCPECKFGFNPSANISLEEVPELMEATNENIKILKENIEIDGVSIKKLEKRIKNIEVEIEKADEADQEYLDAKRKHKSLKNSYTILEDEIEGFKRSIKNNEEIIEKLKEGANKDEKIVKLKEEFGNARTKLKVHTKEMLEWEMKVDENEFWIHHLGKKGFMTFLTNKSIKSIEGITNSYLKKINTDLQVNIDGFTVLKSGDVREKIDVSIIRNGKNVGVYEKYSGGEKGRINLANIVGMQKLFNMSAPNGGLNFLGLDEVFEGLDVTGQKDLIKILEGLGVTTLVVSHRNTPIGANNELIIKKVNGISILKKS